MLAKLLFQSGPTGETLLKTSECNCILPRLQTMLLDLSYQSVSTARWCGTVMRNENSRLRAVTFSLLCTLDRARCAVFILINKDMNVL